MRCLPTLGVIALIGFSPQVVLANDSWQASQSPHFKLAMRNKYGSRRYTVNFQVKTPNQKTYFLSKAGDADEWVEVTFPDDFKVAFMPMGRYTWAAIVDGNVVTSGEFTYSGKWR